MADMARRFPFVWATWVTGLLSGDKQCRFAAWFKAHHEYDKRPEDSARSGQLSKWKSEHGDMVQARRASLAADGWTVTLEGQNKFTVRGKAATLMGGPDLVAVRDRPAAYDANRAFALDGLLPSGAPDADGLVREALVDDCKTGQRRDSDYWQVLVYMTFLPLWHAAVKGRALAGSVSYRDGVLDIPPGAADDAAKGRIYALLRDVGGDAPLEAVPSGGECAWCDIASCPHRVAADEPVTTEDF